MQGRIGGDAMTRSALRGVVMLHSAFGIFRERCEGVFASSRDDSAPLRRRQETGESLVEPDLSPRREEISRRK